MEEAYLDFENELIVYHLFRQVSENKQLIINGKESQQKREIINKYVELYFESIKEGKKKHFLYTEVFRTDMKLLSEPFQSINNKKQLEFVFNMIHYITSFTMLYITLSACFEALIVKENEQAYQHNKKKKYVLDHYFTYLYLILAQEKDDSELSFELIHTAYANRPSADPFYLFLFYLCLNVYLMKHFSNQEALIQFLSFEELFTFISYSLREMKLDETEKYINLVEMKSDPKSFEHKERFNYYQNAYFVFKIFQKEIKFNPQSNQLVEKMTQWILTGDDSAKKFIEKIPSKDNNSLALTRRQIERGNDCILNQIQTANITPMRLMELLTHFYNNLLLFSDVPFPFECQLVEKLLLFIIKRCQSANWKTLFQVPFFQLILFKIFKWYANTKYRMKRSPRDYKMILIMLKIYDKIKHCLYSVFLQGECGCYLRSYQDLFKDNELYLKTRKADCHYKLGQYTKAAELYRSIYKHEESNWKVAIKVVACCFKAYDFKLAEKYYDMALEVLEKSPYGKEHFHQYEAGLNAIKTYLDKFKQIENAENIK